jgi:hypothetical protein
MTDGEIDTLDTVLHSQLREATKGLYAEKAWARSIEVQIELVNKWRSHSVNASDLDGPVWSAQQMNAAVPLAHAPRPDAT